MPHRILVPVDGSELAERAVPWADELAGALSADIELLEVLPPNGEPGDESDPLYLQIEALQKARVLVERAIQVESVVLRGEAAATIVARAEAISATLIAMASHGRSGVARAALGSVASDVVRHSRVPVLVVPSSASAESPIAGRVLVPLDESEHARTVFGWLSPLARELDWTLILCSVADLPPQPIPVQGAAITLPTGPVHTPVDMATYLEELSRGLQAEGFVVEIQVAIGDPSTAIARIAREARAGLIAMSTHGRHGLARWALGSITEAVIQQAPVPVLALHPPE